MKRLVIAIALVISVALLTPPLEAQVEAYDIIIMNGRIVDGAGNPWFYERIDEIDAMFDLLIADNAQTGMIVFLMSEDDVKLALKQPWVSVGVDHGAVALTGPLAEGRAHPRGYGSFPRILGRYVRDEQVVSLEEAIRKMTSLAANRVHLEDRGLLKPGYFADVVVFDPRQVRDEATFEDPNRLSTGMRHVIVNGGLVVSAGQQTNALPGRPLRGPGYKKR